MARDPVATASFISFAELRRCCVCIILQTKMRTSEANRVPCSSFCAFMSADIAVP